MSLCRDFLNQDFAGLSRVDQKVWSSNMSKKSLKVWLPRDVLRIICFCVKHKKIGGTWPFNPHWLISLGRAGAMKGRNVPKPMEKKNLENQFKSLQLRRDLEMERTVIESSSRAVVFRLRNKMTEGPSPVGSSEASTSVKSFYRSMEITDVTLWISASLHVIPWKHT